MPTKKRRVGFIPRSEVLEIIYKLSFESNLSNSKIINILIEEALSNRGLINIVKSNSIYNGNIKSISNNLYNNDYLIKENSKKEFVSELKNDYLNNKNTYNKEAKNDLLDSDIYDKFLMFLEFKEKFLKSDF